MPPQKMFQQKFVPATVAWASEATPGSASRYNSFAPAR